MVDRVALALLVLPAKAATMPKFVAVAPCNRTLNGDTGRRAGHAVAWCSSARFPSRPGSPSPPRHYPWSWRNQPREVVGILRLHHLAVIVSADEGVAGGQGEGGGGVDSATVDIGHGDVVQLHGVAVANVRDHGGGEGGRIIGTAVDLGVVAAAVAHEDNVRDVGGNGRGDAVEGVKGGGARHEVKGIVAASPLDRQDGLADGQGVQRTGCPGWRPWECPG